jgi:hypothetical protein
MNRVTFLTKKIDRESGLFKGAFWVKETNIIGVLSPASLFLVSYKDGVWSWHARGTDTYGTISQKDLLGYYRYETERHWFEFKDNLT